MSKPQDEHEQDRVGLSGEEATATCGAPQAATDLEPPLLPDRWKLQRLLGVGGQAQVWLALDQQLGEMVALKVFHTGLSPEALQRLRREVKLGRELRHPHLVRVYELVEAGPRLAVAMEWVPGGSLKQRLSQGPLSLREVTRVAEDVLSALKFLHEKGIVHRDVKPSNLLLDEEERVRLADLGLARPFAVEPGVTRTETTVGTFTYISPEQLQGQQLTPAADLYSLGVTLFELLTGSLPFAAENELELALLQIKGRIPDPRSRRPDCPWWLARFIMRLLEKSPQDRFPDAGAALHAFSRRRAARSPRAVRQAVLKAGGAGLLGVAVILGWQQAAVLRQGVRAYGITWEGPELFARDRAGVLLWRYRCQTRVVQGEVRDLDGDGRLEAIVATRPPAYEKRRDQRLPPGEVLIFTHDGQLRSRFVPDWQASEEPFPSGTLVPKFFCADLNANGTFEVIVTTHHRTLGWSSLHVFWPEDESWRPVLHHIGWFLNILPVPDPRFPRLRFAANNGPLLETEVIGEVQLGLSGESTPVASNPLLGVPRVWAGFSWYTPYAQFWGGGLQTSAEFFLRPDGTGLLGGAHGGLAIDRWGNPVPGPNAGQDLAAMRLRLLALLARLPDFGFRQDPSAVRSYFARLRAEHQALLRETPYRAILAFFEAQALALAGDHPSARTLLKEAWDATKYEALGVRLAHLQALDGDLDGATTTLHQVMASNVTPMASFYAPRLLTRVAIENRDRHTLGVAAIRYAGPLAPAVALTRARLWWDEASPQDAEPVAYDTDPDAEAITFLARFRLGRVRGEDLERVEEALKRNPDAPLAGKVARAGVLLGLGQAREALTDLEIAIAFAEPTARNDFEVSQLLQVARALQAKALLASGHREAAFNLARQLKPSLRPGLLPAILVKEVLAAGSSKGAGAVSLP